MKQNFRFFSDQSLYLGFCFLFMSFLVIGCKKEKVVVEQPIIERTVVGAGDSKIAYPGFDLHLEADIKAAGQIQQIKLVITPKLSGRGWVLSQVYTGRYEGLTETEFHEHLAVPEDAVVGLYDLFLIVIDKQGLKVTKLTGFEIIKDPGIPLINDIQVKITNNGNGLNWLGTIHAINKIATLTLQVQSAAWTRDFMFPAIIGETAYTLNEQIDISMAPAGHYHINIKITDYVGQSSAYSFHYDKN